MVFPKRKMRKRWARGFTPGPVVVVREAKGLAYKPGEVVPVEDLPANVVGMIRSGHLRPVAPNPVGPDISGARSHARAAEAEVAEALAELGVEPDAVPPQGEPEPVPAPNLADEAVGDGEPGDEETADDHGGDAVGEDAPGALPSAEALEVLSFGDLRRTLKEAGLKVRRSMDRDALLALAAANR